MAAATDLKSVLLDRGCEFESRLGYFSYLVGPVWSGRRPVKSEIRGFKSRTRCMATKIEVAWAAGLLEGEGSFLQKANRKTIVVTCQMTDLDVLQRLQGLFGGAIYVTSKAKPHHKDAWVWCIFGTNAATVMELVKPHMLGRRTARIEKVLAHWHNMKLEKRARQANVKAAGRAYLAGGGTLRQVAIKFNISHETVRQAAISIRGPLA